MNYAECKEFDEYEFYVDGGFSGKDLERPAIKRLIEDIKLRKIDAVIVFKLDRISRSQKDTLYLIEEVFNKYDVGFISIRENFDTTTPFGKAMIGILSVFAQLERETILERTRIGIQKRAEEGKWRGGGKIPFPYRYDKESGTLIPIPEQVEILHKMISLYLSGKSFCKIGEIFGMDDRLVEKRLLSITNTGKLPYRDQVFNGKHEAVVSDELYEEILRVNKLRSKERYERHYLLTGKIVCGHCTAKYRYQKWGKRLIVYCNSQQSSKKRYIKDPNCKNKRWDSFEIEDIVLENLFKMSLDEALFNRNYNIASVDVLKELENRKVKLEIQINNLINFISNGIAVEQTKLKIKEAHDELENVTQKITECKRNTQDYSITKDMLNNLRTSWFVLSFDEKRLIIEHIIDRVEIDNEDIKIYYKIY